MPAANELIQSLYQAFAKGDMPAVFAVLDPKVHWTEADGYPYAGVYLGPEAVKKGVFDRLVADWSAYTTIPSEFVAQGDTVVGIGEYCGTYKATGKTFRAPFAHIWKVRGGKIVSFFQFTDTAVVQESLK